MRIQRLAVCIFLSACIANASRARAQDVFLANPFGGDQATTAEQRKQATDRAKKAEEKKLTRRLAMRINELHKTCDLSESQVRRLQLAAKGAIKNEMKGFDDRVKRVRAMMNGEMNVIEEIGGDVVAEVASTALAAIGIQQRPKGTPKDAEVRAFVKEVKQMSNPFDLIIGGVGLSAVEEQGFWKTQIQKTLKPEQLEKYEKSLASRRRFKRRAIVMQLVVSLDSRLLLTDDQRSQMSKLLDAQLGKFCEHFPPVQDLTSLESFQHFASTQPALARLKQEARDFLTAEQLEELSVTQAMGWEQFGFLMADEFMVGAEVLTEIPPNAGFLGVELAGDDGGVLVESVTEGEAASKAGIEDGDVITAFNGKEISTVNELIELLGETEPKDKVKITIIRDDKSSEIEVTMGSRQ